MKGYVWLRIAGIYFLIGVCFGMYIGIAELFNMASVHAHINLLGWVSLGLSGLIYSLFPAAATSKLGVCHFWLHNIGLPVMVIGLYLKIGEIADWFLIEIGGTLAILGVLLFVINLFVNVKGSSVSLPAGGKSMKQ